MVQSYVLSGAIMNKRQKNILQTQLDDEKTVIKALEDVFKKAKQECENKICELNSRTDMQNLQSIIYQKKYQEALVIQLDSMIKNLQDNTFETILEYLKICYEDGYIGVIYDIRGQGVPLVFPIDQKQVITAIQLDTKLSQGLYKKLGEDTKKLKKTIQSEMSRGIASGSTWLEIAVTIAKGMNSPFRKAYNNAIRIARTEGHRIQNEAALDAQKEAVKRGAKVKKRWDSTLDGRTRPEHRECDGQIREIDEPFDVGGEKMQAPGVGGSAKNVCNCRCTLQQKAEWLLDGGVCKMNNFSKQLESFEDEKSYKKFKKDFFSKENVQYMNYVDTLKKRYNTNYFDEKLLGKITDREYNHYIKLLNNTPIYKNSDYK